MSSGFWGEIWKNAENSISVSKNWKIYRRDHRGKNTESTEEEKRAKWLNSYIYVTREIFKSSNIPENKNMDYFL
jgi:hypothetical protein